MYVLAEIFVRTNMKSNRNEKTYLYAFSFKYVLTFVPICVWRGLLYVNITEFTGCTEQNHEEP
jgi:hypothetical protein